MFQRDTVKWNGVLKTICVLSIFSNTRKVKDEKERQKLGEKIHVLYLNEACQFEVNITDEVKYATVDKIKQQIFIQISLMI